MMAGPTQTFTCSRRVRNAGFNNLINSPETAISSLRRGLARLVTEAISETPSAGPA